MPDIRPFRGVLYNAQKIKDMAKVLSEPYDVISPAQRNAYYKIHPYNIIRLILGRHYPQDNSKDNQYTRAKGLLANWQKQNILLRDKKENIYIYAQSFSHNDKRITRSGFIVLLKLEDFAKNTILPHEHTKPLVVQDRLKLTRATRANLSPIFALFSDPQGKINKLLSQCKKRRASCVNIKKDGITHRIWRMSDRKKIAVIKKFLRAEQIFIADGHHRYEAALNYKIEMQRKKRLKGRSAFNYVMTYLVATRDAGLTILPTHRVVKMKAGFNSKRVVQDLKSGFALHKFSKFDGLFSYMRKSPVSNCVFGAYFGKDKFLALRLKRRNVHKELDVAILHSDIIEGILNSEFSVENISYLKDARQVIELVERGKNRLAFFLNPPTMRQLKKVASGGGRMPHKSTYFYPKLLTGLVINKL